MITDTTGTIVIVQPTTRDEMSSFLRMFGVRLYVKKHGMYHCPFPGHKNGDQTASGKVNDNGTVHCFTCGYHYDSIEFIRQYKGMGFEEAIQELKKYGYNSYINANPVPYQAPVVRVDSTAMINKKPGPIGHTQYQRIPYDAPPFEEYVRSFACVNNLIYMKHWVYKDDEDYPMFVVVRFEKDGKKEFRQFVYTETTAGTNEWFPKGPTRKLPYNVFELCQRKSVPVIVVEGEKACDAAKLLFPNFVCITWAGGANAIKSTDWTLLFKRNVLFIRDNDTAGEKAEIEFIKTIAPKQLIKVKTTKLLEKCPEKWDVADPWPATLTPQDFIDEYNFEIKNEFNYNKEYVLNTAYNAELWLLNNGYRFKYDLFTNKMMYSHNSDKWFDLPDWIFSNIIGTMTIQKEFSYIRAETIKQAILKITHENEFDSLIDYVTSLPKWDNNKRIETVFIDLFGSPDTAFTRIATKTFFLSLIARAMLPGCKQDQVYIFEDCVNGDEKKQGLKKSEFLKNMLPREWVASNLGGEVGSKDSRIGLQGIWGVEIAELDDFKGRENSKLKQFITTEWDWIRRPYEPSMSQLKRRCVFVGSTNEEQYLTDKTGNRRYFPIKVIKELDLKKLQDNREQWLAEALYYFNQGHEYGDPGQWWVEKKDFDKYGVYEEQESRMVENEFIELVSRYIEEEPLKSDKTKGINWEPRPVPLINFSIEDFYFDIFGKAPKRYEKDDIAAALRKNNWTNKTDRGGFVRLKGRYVWIKQEKRQINEASVVVPF